MARITDDKFARLARKMGFLTDAQLGEMKRRQAEVARVGAKLSLSEVAQSDMVLTFEQVKKVLLACEYTDVLDDERKLGELAVSKGLASDEEIKICLDTQKYEFALHRKIPRRLGEIMIEAEILTPESLKTLLADQARLREDERREPTVSVPLEKARPAPAAQAEAPAGKASSGKHPVVRADAATMPYDAERLMGDEPTPKQGFAAKLPAPGRETPVKGSSPVLPAQPVRPARPGAPADKETRRLTARLILTDKDGLDSAFPITGRLTIGRQAGCTIRLDDTRMSREHAAVEYDQQLRHHVVSDLGSRNGTFVNDVRIEAPTVVNPGDQIRVGDAVFTYEA